MVTADAGREAVFKMLFLGCLVAGGGTEIAGAATIGADAGVAAGGAVTGAADAGRFFRPTALPQMGFTAVAVAADCGAVARFGFSFFFLLGESCGAAVAGCG